MPSSRVHVVRQGEWLESIAREYGFPGIEDILEFEPNAKLKESADPNTLNPGEIVWIPPCPYAIEVDLKSAGSSSHALTVQLAKNEVVRLQIKQANGDPVKNTEYVFQIGSFEKPGSTDGDGWLEEEVEPHLVGLGDCTVKIGASEIHLELGDLDPIDTPRGVQARLSNLGFETGEVDGVIGPKTRGALRKFQSENDLAVSGFPDADTKKKLDEKYGG